MTGRKGLGVQWGRGQVAAQDLPTLVEKGSGSAGAQPGATDPHRKVLHRDALAMTFASVASAALGAGFWSLAAALYPPRELGISTAVLSVITSVGLVAAAATGGAYSALLPALQASRLPVFRMGQRLSLGLSIGGGAIGAVASVAFLPEAKYSLSVALLVLVGVIVWSEYILQNATLAALGRARWLPATNVAACVARIVLLAILVNSLRWHGIEVAFVVSTGVIVYGIKPAIARIVRSSDEWPEVERINPADVGSEFRRVAAQSCGVGILTTGVAAITPFLVTVFAGAADGALFALCLTIVLPLELVTVSMCSSLVVHASRMPEHGVKMAQSILVRAMSISAAGAVAVSVAIPVILPILNPQYSGSDALVVVVWLCAGSLMRVFYIVWSELMRSRRQLGAPLLVSGMSAAILIGAIPWLVNGHGAVGASIALFGSKFVLAAGAGVSILIDRFRSGSTVFAREGMDRI